MRQTRRKPQVFLSHITEEAQLAHTIQSQLDTDFLEQFDIFISSDPRSVSVGSKWLDDITAALKSCQVMLILCSHVSVRRPWINFEAGAGWVRGIPVIPICHTGLTPGGLQPPFQMLQGIQASHEAELEKLYHRLSKTLGTRMPPGAYAELAEHVRALEQEYGLAREVRAAVRALIQINPRVEMLFRPERIAWNVDDQIFQLDLDKMRPHLDSLQRRGMITYSVGGSSLRLGPNHGGMYNTFSLYVLDSYYAIAEHVMSE